MKEERNTQPAPSPEAEMDYDETELLLAAGKNGGNRAGAFALLAVVLLLCGAIYYHFSTNSGDAFLTRLDSSLLTHAKLSLASAESGGNVTVVPSWPLQLYASLRHDIAIYTAIAAMAAIIWDMSVRARARRDVYLLHQKFGAEIAGLRARLDMVDNSPVNVDTEQRQQPADTAPQAAETAETKG